MPALLYRILGWALGGAIARMLTGAGLAIFTYTQVVGLVTDALEYAVTVLQGTASASVIGLLMLFGVGDALSMIGSALLTRATIVGLSAFIGVKAPGVGA